MKKKPAKRTPRTPDSAKYDFVSSCMRQLKARVAAGHYRDNPGLEAALSNEPDPAIVLYETMSDPANPPELRSAVAAKLLPFVHKEQSLLVKGGMEDQGRLNVQVVIASWASKNPPAALEAPQRPAVNGTPTPTLPEPRDPEEEAHRGLSMRPTPAPSKDDAEPYAVTRFGATVSRRKFDELRAMSTDMRGYTLISTGQPAIESDGEPAVYAANPSPSGGAEVLRQGSARPGASETREDQFRRMRDAGKLAAPGDGVVITNSKIWDA